MHLTAYACGRRVQHPFKYQQEDGGAGHGFPKGESAGCGRTRCDFVWLFCHQACRRSYQLIISHAVRDVAILFVVMPTGQPGTCIEGSAVTVKYQSKVISCVQFELCLRNAHNLLLVRHQSREQHLGADGDGAVGENLLVLEGARQRSQTRVTTLIPSWKETDSPAETSWDHFKDLLLQKSECHSTCVTPLLLSCTGLGKDCFGAHSHGAQLDAEASI